MTKSIFALIVACAVGGGAVLFFRPFDQPAKAEVEVGINSSVMMANAKDLPVAHYEDYALVFTSPLAPQDGTR
jgi:hypothetical protein